MAEDVAGGLEDLSCFCMPSDSLEAFATLVCSQEAWNTAEGASCTPQGAVTVGTRDLRQSLSLDREVVLGQPKQGAESATDNQTHSIYRPRQQALWRRGRV